jgi:hypothetical protein
MSTTVIAPALAATVVDPALAATATAPGLTVRWATREDYANILALQETNYIDNLPDNLRKDGFLSARMWESQMDEIGSDAGIAVAYEHGVFLGFFCVSQVKHWQPDSIVHTLVHSLKTDFQDTRVDDPEKFCVFGPMCITASARGKDVLKNLYDYATSELEGRFHTGVGFISTKNPRSLNAVAKLGWQPKGVFRWSDRELHALIHDLR